MTFEQKMEDLLQANGMFDSQAKEVVKLAKEHSCNDSMVGRWNDQTDGYPPFMENILWVSTKALALEWIKENCPKAWFKGCFEA